MISASSGHAVSQSPVPRDTNKKAGSRSGHEIAILKGAAFRARFLMHRREKAT
jgi:hypothetical protein